MIINSPAIVIHSLRYSEADLITTLFSEKYGLRSYLLKGVLKSKRGKIRASLFQPLTLLEIEANHKNKGTLESIREAKILVPLQTLHTHPVKTAMVFFLSEVLKNSIREEEANADLFEDLKTMLLWLDTHENINNFHIVFLIKLTEHIGFYPDVSFLELDYFNLQEGCFQKHSTSAYCLKGDNISKLKQFLGTRFEESMNIALTKSVRKDILNMLLVYFELHLHGFKKPKSLIVINEIFN